MDRMIVIRELRAVGGQDRLLISLGVIACCGPIRRPRLKSSQYIGASSELDELLCARRLSLHDIDIE